MFSNSVILTKNKIIESLWFFIYILITVFLLPTSAIASDYALETLAQTSGSSLGGHSYSFIDGRLSINNNGAVAFAGFELSDNSSRLYLTSNIDSPSLLTSSVPVSATGSSRQFGGAAISNETPAPYIVSRERVSGAPAAFIIREWQEGNGLLTYSSRRSSSGIIGNSFIGDFPSATSLVDINDNGVVAFVGTSGPQQDPAIYRTDVGLLFPTVFSTNSVLKPQLANTGDLVVSATFGTQKKINIYDKTGSPKTFIASSISFPTLGDFPGISPDGNYVGFVGTQTNGTQGIYVYAKLPAPLTPRYIAIEEIIAGNNSDGFTDFSPSLNNRIGVISSGGFSKVNTDSDYGGDYRTNLVTVVFTAKRNSQLGVYTVDLLFVDGDFYAKSTPRIVAEVGTTGPSLDPSLPDMSKVTSFTLYDPISYNKDTRDILVAFHVLFTDGTNALYRAKRNCQIPNVKDDKQVNPDWSSEPNGYHILGDGSTIGTKGCAMTSVTNILNYHKVTTTNPPDYDYIKHINNIPSSIKLASGENLDPLISNSIFLGEIINNNSDVQFDWVSAFASIRGISLYDPAKVMTDWPQVPFAEADALPILNTGGNIHLDRIVDFYVCNGQPVVLKVHKQGADASYTHYVVATGRGKHPSPSLNNKLVTTYEINDPANNSIPIKDLFRTSSNGRYYEGHYRGIRVFSTKGFHEHISISAHSPVELLVTDSLGRRIGYDVISAQRYNEIYNASYFHDSINDLDGITGGDTYKTISIGSAKEDDGQIIGDGRGIVMSGAYSIRTIGTNTGPYRLIISSTDEMANSENTVISGITSLGHIENFNIDFGPKLGFTPIVTVGSGVTLVDVPHLTSIKKTDALSIIASSGFTQGIITQQTSDSVAAGMVISQYPYAGDKAFPGIAINMIVSSGSGNSIVTPSVINLSQATAQAALTGAGLIVGTATPQSSNTVPSGSVISQNPTAGASVAAGSAVNLVVSSGPAPVNVPTLVGQTQAAAQTAITGAGLIVGTVTQQSSNTVPSGSVISQNPTAGASVAAGSAVNLVVSSGPAPVNVPTLVGQTQAAAQAALTGAGLIVVTVTQQSSNTVPSGSVISQNPAAGASLAAGSAVNLVVSSGAPPIIAGDLNGDGVANCADLAIVKASFGKKTGTAGFDVRADVNKDDIVNVRDLSFVSQQLPSGTKCS